MSCIVFAINNHFFKFRSALRRCGQLIAVARNVRTWWCCNRSMSHRHAKWRHSTAAAAAAACWVMSKTVTSLDWYITSKYCSRFINGGQSVRHFLNALLILTLIESINRSLNCAAVTGTFSRSYWRAVSVSCVRYSLSSLISTSLKGHSHDS